MSAQRGPRRARRARLGQHFLRSQRVIDRIIAALAPKAGDVFIEIGPGDGALTAPLLDSGATVHAVELDGALVDVLRASHGANPRLHLHHGDALRCDWAALAGAATPRLVGNLPYYLTTPLLFGLFGLERWEDMHFMVQRELAKRLAAAPNSRDWGRLGVMCRYHAETRALFDVPPGAFRPRPQVTSAFVRLREHREAPVHIADLARWRALVRQAFGQRRKMLRRSLAGWVSSEELESLGIAGRARAETLDLAAFAAISNLVSARAAAEAAEA